MKTYRVFFEEPAADCWFSAGDGNDEFRQEGCTFLMLERGRGDGATLLVFPNGAVVTTQDWERIWGETPEEPSR